MNPKFRAALCALAVTAALVVAGGLSVTSASAVILTAPTVKGAGVNPVSVSFSKSGSTAYVVNQSAFVNIDSTSSKKVSHQFVNEGPSATNGEDSGGALSPNGKDFYVAVYNGLGGSKLLEYSTSTRKLVHNYSLPSEEFGETGAVAISPDGATAYIWGIQIDGPNYVDAVDALDLDTGVGSIIPTGTPAVSGLQPSAVVPDGDSAVWATTAYDTVVNVLPSDNGTAPPIATSGIPQGIAMTKDGSMLYVAEANGTIETIDTTADTPSASTFATLASTNFTADALTPDGKYLVVTGYNTGGGSGETWVYSTSDQSLVSQIGVGTDPASVAVAPSGHYAYVGNNGSGTTSIVALPVEKAASISSHTAPSGTVGVNYATTFTASGFPAPTFAFTGTLPTGVSLNGSTGELTGDPSAAGTFKFKIVASNGIGKSSTSKTQEVTIKLALQSQFSEISGTPTVGQTLTAGSAPWGPAPIKFAYKWQRLSGTTWKTISGATKVTYKLPSSSKNDQIRVEITGSKSGYTTVTVPSEPVTVS